MAALELVGRMLALSDADESEVPVGESPVLEVGVGATTIMLKTANSIERAIDRNGEYLRSTG